MGMIMHDDVPYGEGTSYTQGTGIAINNNVIAVDADNTPTENSEKPVKSKGVYSALESNSAESASLLKSTVGWTGKNLLPNNAKDTTTYGITYTVNADGSITSNGTSGGWANLILCNNLSLKKGEYILSGIPNVDGAFLTILKPSGDISCRFENMVQYFELASDEVLTEVRISYRANTTVSDAIFYPMLRDASITDDTYEPYHESVEEVVEQIYADNGVLGAKNLLKYPYKNTTKTQEGVTYTDNGNGSITVSSGGSASTGFSYLFLDDSYFNNFLSKYIGKSITISGGTSDVYIRFHSGVVEDKYDYGDELTIEVTQSIITAGYNLLIGVNSGKTVNETIKPMLRLASDPDDTYVPYAMTNRELTEDTQELKYRVGILSTPVPAYVANHTTARKKNITDDFYNGTLRAEIAAGNFANVIPGDYIIGQSSGSTYYVACLDYRLGKGDQTNNTNYPAYGTHHLGLMLFNHNGATRLWAGYGNQEKSWRVSASDKGRCPWNAATDVDPTDSEAIGTNSTNITRQYNGVNVSGYMGSFIRERIDEIILTEDFIADFGSANVLKYREINGNAIATDKPSGGQGNWNGCTSGWSWYDRFLDLPSEVEIYGSRIFGSAYDTGCQCEQLPLFKNAAIHDFFPRIDIWTKAVASSSLAAFRYGRGLAGSYDASNAFWACPLGCVK